MLLESGAKVFNGISIVVGVLWVVEVLDAISKAEFRMWVAYMDSLERGLLARRDHVRSLSQYPNMGTAVARFWL